MEPERAEPGADELISRIESAEKALDREGTPPSGGSILPHESNFLRQIFDGSPDAMVIVDNEDRVLEISAGFTALFGYVPAEARGRQINDLVAKGGIGREASRISTAVLGGEAVHADTERTHKDGRPIPVSVIAYPIQYGTKQIGVVGVYRDITVQKRTTEQFHDFLETVSAVALILDTRGRIVYANRHFRDLVERGQNELAGADWFACFIEEDSREALRHLFEEILSSGSARPPGSNPILTPSGPRLISWNVSLLRDTHGRPSGLAVLGLDITESERARVSEERRGRILEAVSFAASRFLGSGDWEAEMGQVLEKLGRAADASRSYIFRLTGSLGGITSARRVEEWCSEEGARPPGTEFHESVLPEEWIPVLEGGGVIAGPVRRMSKPGRELLAPQGVLSALLAPISTSSGWWGFIGFDDCGEDREWSTEEVEALRSAAGIIGGAIFRKSVERSLRENTARYAALMDGLRAGVLAEDSDGKVVYTNRVFCRMFGAASPGGVVGLDGAGVAGMIGLQQDGEGDMERVRTGRMEAGRPVLAEEMRLAGGTVIERDYMPIRLGEESFGHLWIFRDVSEQRRNEFEAARAQKLESLGVLAGGIAHDFNNLLTAILGNISLARLKEPQSEADSRLADAEKACLKAKTLTQQLLTFSRGGAPVMKPVDLGRLLSEIASPVFAGSQCSVRLETTDGLRMVNADEGQMNQLFTNILINALQAVPGGGSVSIAAADAELPADEPPLPAGPCVRVTITDDGEGMSPETLERIFDPYFTTRPDSLGLGLATAYSIVKKHGGRISAESAPGAGTVVTVLLPASPAAVPALPETGGDIRGSGRVLVVDDEQMVLSVVCEMLTALGWDPEGAEDLSSATLSMRTALDEGRPFDLLILDLVIPGGPSGVEMLGILRDMDPSVPAIASSGYSNVAVMSDPASHGFDGVVAKPYRLEELGRVTRAVRDAGRRR